MITVRHVAEGSASTTFDEPIWQAPTNTAWEVIECGVIPQTSFGQATNYAILTLKNKGTTGSGTTTIATRSFNSSVVAYVKASLGTISNPSVASDEVLSVVKTVASSGQIVPSGAFYIVLQRMS